jgi:hypothetical protein
MKKRKLSREDHNPEDRKRKLNFKKKRQRNQEPKFNHKGIKGLNDLDEYEDYEY